MFQDLIIEGGEAGFRRQIGEGSVAQSRGEEVGRQRDPRDEIPPIHSRRQSRNPAKTGTENFIKKTTSRKGAIH